MPHELASQFDWMKKRSLSRKYYVEANNGIEAADLIGSFAKKIAENDELAYIASSDKDSAQDISERIFQLRWSISAGKSSGWPLLGEGAVPEQFDVETTKSLIAILSPVTPLMT